MQLARCVALLRRTEIDARNPVFIPLFLRFQALRVAMHQPCEIKLTLLDFVGLILHRQVLVWASFLALYMISVVLLEHASMDARLALHRVVRHEMDDMVMRCS